MGIGWHFYKEGTAKLRGGEFSSANLLGGAVGPLADWYHGFIWDPEGRARLDRDRTVQMWTQYRQDVADYCGFSDEQNQQADEVLAARQRQLQAFFDDHREELHEYFLGLDRWEGYRQDPARQDVPGLASQVAKIGAELQRTRGPWLKELEALWRGYQSDMLAIATGDQRGARELPIERPGRRWMDTQTIDRMIPWFLTAVGALLILGLLTRAAAVAGAAFLATVISSQWPGTAGAMPTYYQVVELIALLFIAAVGAGRFGGLDFLVGRLTWRCCRPRRRAKDATNA